MSITAPYAEDKYQNLLKTIRKFERVAVAFSGGVDSTLLYYAAKEALGDEEVLVLHAVSALISARELQSAADILLAFTPPAEMHKEVFLQPLSWPEFVANTGERCYLCKKRMYSIFLQEAALKECSVLLDGSNVDDLKSVRPGYQAIRELGVQTPLLDAELSKLEIRFLAEKFGLANYAKPSNSCLATRLPEGVTISRERLELVESCEAFLLTQGIIACRVRIERQDAVLQLSQTDSGTLFTEGLHERFLLFMQDLGFTRVLLDLTFRQ